MARRLAIIIGVNQYQDPTFRPLQFAENDARALTQWLVNDKGGKWSSADVQLLQGAYASRYQIESLISQVCVNVAEPGDLALIYFGGHAFLDESKGESYLAVADTRYQQPSTGINLLSLAQNIVGRSPAANILFILDCFQTGQVWSTRRASPYDSKPLLSPTLLNALQQGAMFFCSCRGNELAPEAGERNLGLFVYRTIVGLCGSASDPTTGQVTLQRLHTFLFSALGERHRPQLFGQEQSPLVLVGNMPSPTYSLHSVQPSAGFLSSSSFAQQAQPTVSDTLLAQAPQDVAATAQMSPTTSGALPAVEQQRLQQVAMLLRQARHLIQVHNPGDALNLVEQAVQIAPTDISALILKGQLLGTAGRFPEALAIVEQVIQFDASNALAWSMRAALLTNMGQYQAALVSVEHSLELDPNDPETHAIKTTILEHRANVESTGNNGRGSGASGKRGGPVSFLLATTIQFFSLLIGLVGAALLILLPSLPATLALALMSFGLAAMCINAARGSYVYGMTRLLLTIVVSGIAAGIVAGAFRFEYARVTFTQQHFRDVITHPQWLVPFVFLAAWLALAAGVPVLLALGGFIGGLALGVRRRGPDQGARKETPLP